MTSLAEKATISCVSVFLLVFYIASLSLIEINRESSKGTELEVGLWSLPPDVLSALTGEFKGIVAAFLVLDAGSRVGARVEYTESGEKIVVPPNHKIETIYQILKASQSLDPAFQPIYTLAEGWLPWEVGFVEETNGILRVAQHNRPWDYYPTQLLAFNSYYFQNDYKRAGRILLDAAKKENAPKHFAILGARLSHTGGDTKAATLLLQYILENKSPDDPGFESLQKRLEALKSVLILEKAVRQYTSLFSSVPESTRQLIEKNILKKVPKNPYNFSFCINHQGRVFFDRPYCREVQKN